MQTGPRIWKVMTVKCAGGKDETARVNNTDSDELVAAAAAADDDNVDNDWQRRMRELQGAIILVSLVEVTIGMTGVMGVLVHYIGPLTVASVITMVGLPLIDVIASFAQHNWLIAFLYVSV